MFWELAFVFTVGHGKNTGSKQQQREPTITPSQVQTSGPVSQPCTSANEVDSFTLKTAGLGLKLKGR